MFIFERRIQVCNGCSEDGCGQVALEFLHDDAAEIVRRENTDEH